MRSVLLLLLLLLALPLVGQEWVSLPPGPWDQPELQAALDARTFYASFDHGFLPDLAAGEAWKPRLEPPYNGEGEGPQHTAGLVGQGLLLGSGAATYPVAGNFPVTNRGAVALWVKPVDWQRPNGSYVTFIIVHGGRFYLQRQGPAVDEDGRTRRHEHIQFLAKASPEQRNYTTLSGGQWENDRWYFLVANWSWPTMQLSINGQPFAVKSLPGRPVKGTHGAWFIVGSRGGDGGVLDELMIFDRPLELAEVQALYAAGRAVASEQ